MTNKILRSILGVATAVLLASLIVVTGFINNYFTEMQVVQLKDELSLVATATDKLGIEYLKNLDSNRYRLTLVSSEGKVLFDTKVDAKIMENHLDREEIKEAFDDGTGGSARRSSTLMEKTIYESVKLSDGTVLRISVSQATSTALIIRMLQPIIGILLIAFVLSALIANRMAKKITEPLNKLDLERPLENNAYVELYPLLNRIHGLHREIDNKRLDVEHRKAEFDQVTGNMKEGLVLLDNSCHILSMNPAAQKLFGVQGTCTGENFLIIDHKQDMSPIIEEALHTGHSEIRADRGGRKYQFDISRIQSGENTVGAVLLAFDVTEQANAERVRREFSANVSHELKTPLQSIIGSAELIENGLVKQEDMSRFVGHIRGEAARLVSLVEDIIRLSQLDEGADLPTEEVSLYALTNEVMFTLKNAAEKKEIMLSLKGDKGYVKGIKRLLYEVVYNLCDNAIKYNVEGGSVTVEIKDNRNDTVLMVTDTGIGIPQEHQSRVFERFYRVDKSHSRKSGGTGLGLSIVKHAVLQHSGKIHVESDTNKGTVITVNFPKK